jgi:multiple sugar transport system substrate-binding protein
MAKCDGHIYSIPSALADDNGVYAAFNRDYISDDVINSWDGSIDGIYQILKASEWDNSKAPGFQYLINEYVFGDMIGCEIRNGLCFDYDTMSVENPLESQKFTEYLKGLDKMKKDGYLKDDETGEITYLNNIGLNNEEILQNVKSGNFVVALCSGEIDENFQKDNIAVKTVEHYLTSRVNASIGIAKNTKDVDAVVEFLGLLYGNGKYADILLYGQEGTDYKVVDGVACNTDGTDLEDDYLSKLCLDLFINVYPVTGERYMENRKDEFFALYDNAGVSPFIGFEPDTENLNNISNDLSDFMNGLNGKSVEESIEGAKEKLTADGMDSYLDSVRNQWEEYKQ